MANASCGTPAPGQPMRAEKASHAPASDHSRRDFLKVTGFAAGATLLGAGSATAAALVPLAPSPWDRVPVILDRITPPTFPDRVFNIVTYGAKGDGKTKNTAAFRTAIEAANKAGGGRVLVPAGTFLTGAIRLLSNVDLHVAQDATIKFSTDPKDFMPMVYTRWQGIECFNFSPFIYAYTQQNIGITGSGTIDGQAAAGPWFDYDKKRGPDWDRLQQMVVDGVPIEKRTFGTGHFLKPNMIQLYQCQNIIISDVSLRNPAMWTVHPVLSRNVTVSNIKVYSRGGMVDGCDPEASSDVHITGCQFDTGDDGIAVKSGRDTDGRRIGVPSENIVIEKCTFLGRWGALTVGSEMSGGARNIFFQDCTIRPGSSYRAFHVLYIKTNKRRGGTVDGIHARRITASKVDREAIRITMNYSLTGPGFGPIVNPVVQNITVDNMVVDGASYAVNIDGLSASHVKHVHISNSKFSGITNATPKKSNADDVTFTKVSINGKNVS